MKKFVLVLVLSATSMAGYAQETVQYQKGDVIYSGACEGGHAYVYMARGKLQRPCIGSTDAVSRDKLIRLSRQTNCSRHVWVQQGTVRDGVLYATEVQEYSGCR